MIFIVPLELLRCLGGVVRLAYHGFVLALMLVGWRIVVINGAGRRKRDRKIRRYSCWQFGRVTCRVEDVGSTGRGTFSCCRWVIHVATIS
jgi:hypothetical protein